MGEVHRYRPRARRIPGWLFAVAAGLMLLQLVGRQRPGESRVGSLVILLILVLLYLVPRQGPLLELTHDGVQLGRRSARWEEIDRIGRRPVLGQRFGPRYDAFLLVGARGRHRDIPFGHLWRNWRQTPIRDDIERWAPRLLESAP